MTDELMHYGILGMHWGVRRYQNPDGSLTAAGRKHYAKEQRKENKKNSKSKKSSSEKPATEQFDANGHKIGEPYTKEELMSFRSATQVWAHRNEYTDVELNQVMNRINSETRLREMMSKENEKHVSAGKKFVKEVAANALKETAKTAATGLAKYEAKKLATKLGNEDIAKAMFGGGDVKKKDKGD